MSFTLDRVPPTLIEKMLSGLRQTGNSVSAPAAQATTPPSTVYRVSGNGVQANVTYYESANAAVITVLDKPWFVPESLIEDKVREALAVARSA